MRLMQLMAGAPHGGAETFFADLAVALARAGIVQHIVTRPAPGRVASLSDAGCGVSTARFGGWWDFATRRTIARAVADFSPDVVLSWMNRAAAAMPRGPFATAARLGGYYNLKYYRHCDTLICNTEDIRAYVVAAGRNPAHTVYIPNFCPVGPEPAVDRKSLGTPEGTRVLLILARLETSKGIDVAIRALAKTPKTHLWIAGEGSQLKELERLAAAIGVADRVKFLGWRTDRAAVLRAADVVLVPSRHEPFGNVVINAWAYGRPVIAARAQGPRALINDGVDGVLVDIDDDCGLAGAIERVLSAPDLAERLAVAGAARSRAEFSESAVVQKYISVLDGLVRGPSPPTDDLPLGDGGA